MAKDSLSVTDNRTGKTYELPINHSTINAADLRQLQVSDDDFGLMTYDPGFYSTAACESRITYIDGDKGILRYRGYPIEQLAEKSTFPEVAYLLIFGELPTQSQLAEFEEKIADHMMVHENIRTFIDGFQHDAHPMGILTGTVAALSTFHPDAKNLNDVENRRTQIYRLIGKMPTLAAFAYRHRRGYPCVYPDSGLGYAGNFLHMLFKRMDRPFDIHPKAIQVLDALFILHADHEQNCSTSAMRSVGSSRVDPFSATAAAIAALYGPLHGGANEAVLRMLKEIGTVANVPKHIERVKAGESRLMGFGHRVYKNYDPRARIVKRLAYEVIEVVGKNPLIDVALELERIALEDDYFVKRKLYPNVDFYTGIIYDMMGFPVDLFTVLFAIPRTAGWLAQWEEMMQDPQTKLARPRQIYLGADERNFVPMGSR